jgi:proteasome accessory factor A
MLLGLETEYAISPIGAAGVVFGDRNRLAEQLIRKVGRRFAYLPDGSSGIFLSSGARLYVDAGSHPEWSTPECPSPRELVRHIVAGERVLTDALAELRDETPSADVQIFRCNVHYGGSPRTWGCHESYLCRRPATEMATALIPHLVSRIVFSGAGGFDNIGLAHRFLLSPRVPHLVHAVSHSSTEDRGIVHTKDEPLVAGEWRRLHLICGESLCSQRANFLKVGTTALVARLIDLGQAPRIELAGKAACGAMCAFARDPEMKATVALSGRGRASALEIQQRFLEACEQRLGRDEMPSWADEVCRSWRRMLDRLALGPEAVATRLDWAIKWSLYRRQASLAGVPWHRAAIHKKLQPRLFELDTRFGALAEDAPFRQLDAAGVLEHRLPRLGSVEAAMHAPPSSGRATLRSKAIRELAGNDRDYLCDWDRVVDKRRRRILRFVDPFGPSTDWSEFEDEGGASRDLLARLRAGATPRRTSRRASTRRP